MFKLPFKPSIFLISLAASFLICVERQWEPGNEAQSQRLAECVSKIRTANHICYKLPYHHMEHVSGIKF